MPTTTGMSAPAATRPTLRLTAPASGLLILRQLLPQAAQSIRNAPSASVCWKPERFRQPAAASILTATAPTGRTMLRTTGMSALAEIRPIRRHTISSGLLTRKRPQRKRAPSMRSARFAATRRRQLRFRLPAPQQNRPILRKPTRAPAQKARKPVTTAI